MDFAGTSNGFLKFRAHSPASLAIAENDDDEEATTTNLQHAVEAADALSDDDDAESSIRNGQIAFNLSDILLVFKKQDWPNIKHNVENLSHLQSVRLFVVLFLLFE